MHHVHFTLKRKHTCTTRTSKHALRHTRHACLRHARQHTVIQYCGSRRVFGISCRWPETSRAVQSQNTTTRTHRLYTGVNGCTARRSDPARREAANAKWNVTVWKHALTTPQAHAEQNEPVPAARRTARVSRRARLSRVSESVTGASQSDRVAVRSSLLSPGVAESESRSRVSGS